MSEITPQQKGGGARRRASRVDGDAPHSQPGKFAARLVAGSEWFFCRNKTRVRVLRLEGANVIYYRMVDGAEHARTLAADGFLQVYRPATIH